MGLLADHFQVFAVDLRGQGRSSRTPGRYTLDNMGNDLVRFIDVVIGRPTLVSGLSSGGVLSAWLSAYAKPGQVVAALYEDPPLFASEVRPAIAPGIPQSIGPIFHLWSTYLGDQWSIGAWDAMGEAASTFLPEHLQGVPFGRGAAAEPEGIRPRVGSGVLDRHGRRVVRSRTHAAQRQGRRRAADPPHAGGDEDTGFLFGAMSDQQADRVQALLRAPASTSTYRSFPDVGHSMHGERPELYVETLLDWVKSLDV